MGSPGRLFFFCDQFYDGSVLWERGNTYVGHHNRRHPGPQSGGVGRACPFADSGCWVVFQLSHPVSSGAKAGLFSPHHLAQTAGKARAWGRLSFPGSMHCFGCHCGHRQHRRGGRGHCHWWTRRNFLDVGCRPTGYGGEVCGGGPGGSLSGTGWAGRVSGWPNVLHQTWFWAPSGPGWGAVLRLWHGGCLWRRQFHPNQHSGHQC